MKGVFFMPYNEHVAIIRSRNLAQGVVRRTRGSCGIKVSGVEIPEDISVFWNIDKEKNGRPFEIRFSSSKWNDADARSWLKDNGFKYDVFTPAEPKDEKAPCYTATLNKSEKTLDIILHDDIGFWGTQSKEFTQLLHDNKDVKIINVDLNSHGGSVFDGFSIYNNLRAHPATVNMTISGIAASIASVIAMAGDKIDMPENAMLMIHKPFFGFLMNMDASDLRKKAEALDKMEKGIIAAYRTKTEKSEAEIASLMEAETWLTAEEAKGLGLADSVSEEIEIKNYFDFSKYNYLHTPETVLNKFDVNHGETTLDIVEPPVLKTGLEYIVDYVKKSLNIVPPNKKEIDMPISVEELEKKVNGLNDTVNGLNDTIGNLKTDNEALKTENKSLKTENDSLKASVSQINAAMQSQTEKTREDKFRDFCNGLVTEGKMLPAHIDQHVATLIDKYRQDEKEFTDEKKETPRVDEFKNFLNSLPVVVPVGERQVANKDGSPPASTGKWTDKKIEEAINKIMDEKKIGYADAVIEFGKQNPTVDILNN